MFEKIKEVFRPLKSSGRLHLVDAIKRDHFDLKEMIELLKDDDVTYSEKRKIYPGFASLFRSHTWAEERAVYEVCQKVEELRNLAMASFEGHRVAQDLMTKIQETRPRDLWVAKVKVLAEVIELHLQEEEREFLPLLDDHWDQMNEQKMVEQFVSFRQRSQKSVHHDNAGILDQVQ